MHPNEIFIHRFYRAFQQKDYRTMQESYHPEASFSDPVFGSLTADETKAMWQMLITSAKDLEISFGRIVADDEVGRCRWEARYLFSGTGRKVHNIIRADFVFKDGLIMRHNDDFDFWRWSRMALGRPGLVMGWSPYLLNAVRGKVKKRLERWILEKAST